MAKILVTGVNGFVGKHLVQELKQRQLDVIGLGREADASEQIKASLDDYWSCDLMDQAALAKLELQKIDSVINLAGLARVGQSFSEADKYLAVNVGVLANLCQALDGKKLRPKIIAISSSSVYDPNQPLPITEDSATNENNSPYAKSKLLMEAAAQTYRDKGFEIVVVRPFNHIGPGQQPGFLVGDLYKNLTVASQSGAPLKTGNLTTRREYTDVRDVVRAYADLATAASLDHNLYNVCRGESVTGETVLKTLMEAMGLNNIEVTTDPSLLRPNDIQDLYGSYERIRQQAGWQPQIPLQKSIDDFVKSQATSA